ncbi:MAG: squalene--hopene cyclase, partial [Gemmataceae bacterium]
SDGVGSIFPPMIYTVVALRCLGYADDAPEMIYALKQLDDLILEEEGKIRLQPCVSPVWDTGIALNAVADALPEATSLQEREALRSSLERGVAWVLTKEVRRRGDWAVTVPHLQPGGWFFEYNNAFYPDTDDTAMVLMALQKCRMQNAECRVTEDIGPAVERGLHWLLGMQNDDAGWAAFDRNINRQVLEQVPFADHNAMLDPSCPDITARVFESLGYHGFKVGDHRIDRAIDFVRKEQDPCGAWWGRWGVNYLYGTWQVLQGLQSVGFDMKEPMVRRAVAWLEQVQQAEGSWGETCRSYDDPALKGQGEPTASQTAWAVLGLIAAGETQSNAVQRGIDYLVRTQQPDGNWHEAPFTGTGFPKVFYLKYHLYSLYFPLMALARYQRAAQAPVHKS